MISANDARTLVEIWMKTLREGPTKESIDPEMIVIGLLAGDLEVNIESKRHD